MRKYDTFFAEESVRNLPEFERISVRYPKLQWIEDYQTFRNERITREKRCLIFARKRGAWLKKFHCYDSEDYSFLSLDLAEGCLFDCVYCYLQTYLNHGALVLFLGLDSLLKELSGLDSKRHWISTGLLSDSLLVENQFSYLPAISRQIPANSVVELRSKSNEVSFLADPSIRRNCVVISWSLNPPEIVSSHEYGTASLEDRLAAARQVIRFGYRIALHLDPVFYFDGWREAYERLFAVLDSFPRERCAFLSLGLFRYMPHLGPVIRNRFPFHALLSQEFIPDEDGKYHYFRPIRKEMYEAFQGWLQTWKGIPVFRSMEPSGSF